MIGRGRTVLGLVYCSLVFGVVLAPYLFIALGALTHLVPVVVAVVVPLLLVATWVVMLGLTKGQGRFGLVATCVAFCALCAVLGLFANFGLPEAEQYWFSLIIAVAVSSVVAFVVIVFTSPSRMERFISAKTSEARYRVGGYVLLGMLVLVAGLKVCQYFAFSHPVY